MMEMRIRALQWPQDREAVLSFQREIYETNFAGFVLTPEFLREYSSLLRRAVGDRHEGLFVLDDGETVRGFLWVAITSTLVDPWCGYIKNIYVAPTHRRQGWGRRLLERAEGWLSERGVSCVELDCTVGNEAALALYESAGYSTCRYRMSKRCDAKGR